MSLLILNHLLAYAILATSFIQLNKTRKGVSQMRLADRIEKLVIMKDDPVYLEKGPYDVIICIGCSLNYTQTGCSPMSRAIALQAKQRFNAGQAKKVMFVGRGHTKADLVATEAIEMWKLTDIPEQNCYFELTSHTTPMNAREIKRLMHLHSKKTAIVIAQQLHARRVKKSLAKVGIKGRYIAVVKAQSEYGDSSKWFLNSFWTFLIWDCLAMAISWVRRWI